MTMHVVLGDGELPTKELDALLMDISDKANKADDPFWFLIQGKAEPTATDQALARWLNTHDVYYDVITDGSETDIYEKLQNKYTVKRLAPKIVSLMQETPDAGEDARLLALFASDDPDAEEDRWLNDVIQAVSDAGYPVIAMNDGMQEIKLVNTEVEEEEVAEVVPLEPRKAAATKKAAVQPEQPEQAELPLETEAPENGYTREQLKGMDLDGLKEVAAKMGIELPPRTRMPTYIERILGNSKDDEVEVTEVEIPVEEEPVVAQQPYINTTSGSTYSLQGNTTNTFTTMSVSAPAMLIVVYNGTVMSRAVTQEEAQALMGA